MSSLFSNSSVFTSYYIYFACLAFILSLQFSAPLASFYCQGYCGSNYTIKVSTVKVLHKQKEMKYLFRKFLIISDSPNIVRTIVMLFMYITVKKKSWFATHLSSELFINIIVMMVPKNNSFIISTMLFKILSNGRITPRAMI